MLNNRYQEMVFAIDNYNKWSHDDEAAREEMWKDISKFLQALFKNNNIAVIREDERDIIVIEYEHDERMDAWGCANPCWITYEEQEQLSDVPEDEEYEIK